MITFNNPYFSPLKFNRNKKCLHVWCRKHNIDAVVSISVKNLIIPQICVLYINKMSYTEIDVISYIILWYYFYSKYVFLNQNYQ